MLDVIQIGKKLAELRNRDGWTQEGLSEKLFVSHQAVSKWENGGSLPSIDSLVALTELYHVSIEELLCLNLTPSPGEIEELFETHDRAYLIREAIDHPGDRLRLAEILHRLDDDERAIAISWMIQKGQSIDLEIWARLSPAERMRILQAAFEKKIDFDMQHFGPYLTPGEIKQCKEHGYENYQNVTVYRR